MITDQEYRNLEAENARLAAEVDRLTKERDDDRKREYGYSQQTVDALQSTIAQQAEEIERERAARKTAQESLEQYKGECTRLQHEVDRLKGEVAQQSGEIERLKNVISLSEDSRLMDEYLKLERDHERQAERARARMVAAKNVIGWDEVPYKLHVAIDALFDALAARPAAGQAAAPEPVADQLPVARVTGYFDGHCVVAPLNTAVLLPVGMALFAKGEASQC